MDRSQEERDRLLEWLTVPFDPEQVEWKPQTIVGQKALAVPYAGPRAYSDRLNLLFGVGGWSEEYDVHICPPGRVLKKIKTENKTTQQEVPYSGKVLVICTVMIDGLGVHKGTGECDATDDNALTSADAMALKRACSRFGLGRYFYDLPKIWAPYQSGEFMKLPELPDWATPRRPCFQCRKAIEPATVAGVKLSSIEVAVRSFRAFDHELCVDCSKEQRTPKAERKKA